MRLEFLEFLRFLLNFTIISLDGPVDDFLPEDLMVLAALLRKTDRTDGSLRMGNNIFMLRVKLIRHSYAIHTYITSIYS